MADLREMSCVSKIENQTKQLSFKLLDPLRVFMPNQSEAEHKEKRIESSSKDGCFDEEEIG